MDNNSRICMLCNTDSQDEVTFGPLLSRKNIMVHHHCMYLASTTIQGETISHGILGFLITSIRNTIQIAKSQECTYCKCFGATIKCCNSQCNRIFHYNCGINSNCHYEFLDAFNSFCHEHINFNNDQTHGPRKICIICFEIIGLYNPIKSIPTCCYRGWMHVNCTRKYAISAGYYLTCLQCCSSEYGTFLKRRGVFVPDRDATWEHKNAYGSLLEKYVTCAAKPCKCPFGTNYTQNIGEWSIIKCMYCDLSTIHEKCNEMENNEDFHYLCEICDKLQKQNLINVTEKSLNDFINVSIKTVNHSLRNSIKIMDKNSDVIDIANDIDENDDQDDLIIIEPSYFTRIPIKDEKDMSCCNENSVQIIESLNNNCPVTLDNITENLSNRPKKLRRLSPEEPNNRLKMLKKLKVAEIERQYEESVRLRNVRLQLLFRRKT